MVLICTVYGCGCRSWCDDPFCDEGEEGIVFEYPLGPCAYHTPTVPFCLCGTPLDGEGQVVTGDCARCEDAALHGKVYC